MHSHGHIPDILCDPGDLGSLPGVVQGQLRCGDRDIGEDISLEKLSVLGHDTHFLSQRTGIDLVQIAAVIVDRALLGLFKSQKETDKSGFSASGPADNSDIISRVDLQGEVIQDQRTVFLIAERDMVELDVSPDAGNNFLSGSNLRLCLQNGFRHFQDRRKRSNRDSNTCQGTESTHDTAVSRIEAEISGRPHTGLHRQIVEYDISDKTDRCHDHTVDFKKHGRIVFQFHVFCKQLSPARKSPLFGSGQTDLADTAHQGIAHAILLRSQFHLLPGDTDLQQGCQKAGEHSDQNDHNRRYDKKRCEFENLCDVQKREHGTEPGRKNIAQQHAAQRTDCTCTAGQFARGETSEKVQGQSQDTHHDCCFHRKRCLGGDPVHQKRTDHTQHL